MDSNLVLHLALQQFYLAISIHHDESLNRIAPSYSTSSVRMLETKRTREIGASSLFGLMAEMGPLLLNDLSMEGLEYEASGVPTLFYNPSGWTKMGSLLIFDWPPPVCDFHFSCCFL